MTSRGLSLSRSLASLQGKILGCSAFESLPLFTSLSSSAALPLESGCKGTHFFRFCNFYAILFCFCKSLNKNQLYVNIFWTREKRTETALHYVFRAGVCAHAYTRIRKRERQKYMPNRYKKQQKRGKSCPEFFCTKAKNRKNARKMQETESPVHHKIRDYSILHDK